MNVKWIILSILGRDDLKHIVDDLGIDGVDRRSVEGMWAKLSRSRKVTADDLLGYLRKDELKAAYEKISIPTTGKRGDLVERLLDHGQPAKTKKVSG